MYMYAVLHSWTPLGGHTIQCLLLLIGRVRGISFLQKLIITLSDSHLLLRHSWKDFTPWGFQLGCSTQASRFGGIQKQPLLGYIPLARPMSTDLWGPGDEHRYIIAVFGCCLIPRAFTVLAVCYTTILLCQACWIESAIQGLTQYLSIRFDHMRSLCSRLPRQHDP